MQGTVFQKIALLMGGDLGREAEVFQQAVRALERGGVTVTARSRIVLSAPVDCVPGTPDFRNQALCGLWSGTPLELLKLCQCVERAAGRPAEHSSREARILDCDIILFGEEIVSLPELVIPHPRARQRAFVLKPLAEIAGAWRFPDTGESVLEALDKLPEQETQSVRFGEAL